MQEKQKTRRRTDCRCFALTASIATALLFSILSDARAAITYVDATGGVGGNTVRTSNGSATDWIGATNLGTDNLWFNRTAGATQFGGGTVWETLVTENAPVLTTTLTGLADGNYDVYVYFGADSTSSTLWGIQAGFLSTSLTQYTSASSDTTKLFDDASFDGWRVKIGTTAVTGGSLNVFIDNRTGSGGERTYYDGIGYELSTVPEPGSISLMVLGSLSLALLGYRRGRTKN